MVNDTGRDDGSTGLDDGAEAADVGAGLQRAFWLLLRWGSRASVRAQFLSGELGRSLTPTDVWIVEVLAERGPMRLTALAAWQGVDKSTVTPQVRRLERAGLVVRTADPQDGRAVLLSLSEEGLGVRDRFRRAGAAVLEDRLASWSEEDRRVLAELLGRFVEGLDVDRSAGGSAPTGSTAPSAASAPSPGPSAPAGPSTAAGALQR
ncbi:MarR family transcriptional regulator [Georgenia daeguensis]|uniref:HTH marR-type domain-containing protein n=1 Tax=Georgenia daeguensis TaxID=908355 RepID=A0ABP8ERB3_9MICO